MYLEFQFEAKTQADEKKTARLRQEDATSGRTNHCHRMYALLCKDNAICTSSMANLWSHIYIKK